jgi:hypothetical protein
MAKKKKKAEPPEPSEIPLPSTPEIKPGNIPEEPVLPEEEPETFPEKEPDEPKPPPELPETE